MLLAPIPIPKFYYFSNVRIKNNFEKKLFLMQQSMIKDSPLGN